MNIITYIFEPAAFFGILTVLFTASFLVIFSFIRHGKRLSREIQENAKKDKIRISELEEMLIKKEEFWKKELAVSSQMYEGLKEQYNELERDMEKLTKELERQL